MIRGAACAPFFVRRPQGGNSVSGYSVNCGSGSGATCGCGFVKSTEAAGTTSACRLYQTVALAICHNRAPNCTSITSSSRTNVAQTAVGGSFVQIRNATSMVIQATKLKIG